jgi:hypothetical protein
VTDPTGRPRSDGERVVCFTAEEGHLILWALAEAMANAEAADALSEVAFLRPVIHLVHRRIDQAQEE